LFTLHLCYREVNDETSLKCIARGYCLNKNTIDSFKMCDKNELLKEFGGRLLDDFQSGRAIEDPSLIPTFDILMYTVSYFIIISNNFVT